MTLVTLIKNQNDKSYYFKTTSLITLNDDSYYFLAIFQGKLKSVNSFINYLYNEKIFKKIRRKEK